MIDRKRLGAAFSQPCFLCRTFGFILIAHAPWSIFIFIVGAAALYQKYGAAASFIFVLGAAVSEPCEQGAVQ